MVYSYYSTLLHLLKIGIPYDSIISMEEEEINMILGIESAMTEIQNENSQMQSDLRRSQN